MKRLKEIFGYFEQGRWQKNFQKGNGKKDRKIAKKIEK